MVERSRVKQNNSGKRFYFYFAFLGVFFLVSEGLVGLAAEPFLAAALTGVFLEGLLALDGVFLAAALPSFFVALDGVFLAAAFFFDGVTVFNFFLVANAPTDFLFALAFSLVSYQLWAVHPACSYPRPSPSHEPSLAFQTRYLSLVSCSRSPPPSCHCPPHQNPPLFS